MLNVWCVWWRDPANPDKYTEYHVHRLQRTVAENLTEPHQFICVTDQPITNCWKVQPLVDWPGWWQKLYLFAPDFPASERNLYLDLDVVITGSLDELVQGYCEYALATPWNWAQSGHGGCQSSVMAWSGSQNTQRIFTEFDPAQAHWPPINKPGVLWGDQEWITQLRDERRIAVEQINAEWVKSYKYHCRHGVPDDCRVVVFHGEPKPESVREPWFQW